MSDVLEGFLCPLCMKDLGDVIQLQLHFEENHSKEDQAFVQSLKDLFGIAKKKILNDNEANNVENLPITKLKLKPREDDNLHPVSGVRTDLFPAVTKGELTRNHFSEFKKLRSCRVDRFATETNRLIVRLDRLLEGMPVDASKRREHEQAVVQWVQEQLVKLCPNCARTFNLGRRKHHCRLCGSVMCGDCSKFVEWNFCRKLINPSTISVYRPTEERLGWSVNGKSDSRSVGGSPARSTTPLSSFKLRRSNSKESMNSLMSSMMEGGGRSGGEEFRVCEYCEVLLKRREAAIDLQTVKPIISQFYEKLREYTIEGTELSEKYLTMAESLHAGETVYHLSDAKLLRMKLLKIAENVDIMSKKIAALGTETGSEAYLQSRKFLLQSQIRRASVHFIKETLVGLPSLPSEEALVVLQENRRKEMARRVEEERKRAQEARLKYKLLQEKRSDSFRSPRLPNSKSDQSIKYEAGFVLSSSDREHSRSVSDDPMVEQMNIIRGYIAKAREAHRFDEVAMLETNLKDLQTEYKRMKEEETAAAAVAAAAAAAANHSQYESFNLSSADSSENLGPPESSQGRSDRSPGPLERSSGPAADRSPAGPPAANNNSQETGRPMPLGRSGSVSAGAAAADVFRAAAAVRSPGVAAAATALANSAGPAAKSLLSSLNPFGGENIYRVLANF